MGILKIKIAAAQEIVFGSPFLEFLRGETSTNNLDVNYSNGIGQTLANNEILYTNLTPVDDGYIQVKSTSNYTLSNSGTITLEVTHKVSVDQADQNVSFSVLGSNLTLQLVYQSKPVAGDITLDVANRTDYIFQLQDFEDQYSDFDNDAMSHVAIFGDVTGYYLNNIAYNAGDWISISDIDNGLFKYVPLDQNAYYEKDNTYKVRDINGNESV